MTRVLVAGSRDWPEPEEITRQLDHAHATFGEILLVHGAALRGADAIADRWARDRAVDVERHPARWQEHDSGCPEWHRGMATCKRAGMRRNAEMVVAGADLCLVFIYNGSAGSAHTMRTAAAAGIPTWVFVPGQPPRLQGT